MIKFIELMFLVIEMKRGLSLKCSEPFKLDQKPIWRVLS